MTMKRPKKRASNTTPAAIASAVNVFLDFSSAERPRLKAEEEKKIGGQVEKLGKEYIHKNVSQGSLCQDLIVATGITRLNQHKLNDEDPAPEIRCHYWSTKT